MVDDSSHRETILGRRFWVPLICVVLEVQSSGCVEFVVSVRYAATAMIALLGSTRCDGGSRTRVPAAFGTLMLARFAMGAKRDGSPGWPLAA